jgi:hypothetical protein
LHAAAGTWTRIKADVMAQCFCGCGRKVSFRRRPINKRGAIINGDLAKVRALLAHGLESPNAEIYVHDGELLCSALAEAVHANLDPGPELEHETRGFMRFGQAEFGDGALGRAVRRAGLSADEALAAMARGERDPFADIEIPR